MLLRLAYKHNCPWAIEKYSEYFYMKFEAFHWLLKNGNFNRHCAERVDNGATKIGLMTAVGTVARDQRGRLLLELDMNGRPLYVDPTWSV